MARRSKLASVFSRALRSSSQNLRRATDRATKIALDRRKLPEGPGQWVGGSAIAFGGVRRFHLYRPPGIRRNQKLPLVVMLHGCTQTARDFAVSTGMHRLAAKERFLVLYPEQDRRINPQGCWRWYDVRGGGAQLESALILASIDQACLLHGADPARVAIAGLSAGAGMAALVAARHPERFRAVMMHSGVGPGTASSSAGALEAMGGRRTPRPMSTAGPPLLVVHGDADRIVSSRNAAAAAETWAGALAARAAAPRRVQRGRRHAMTITDFRRDRRTLVTLCEVHGLGHAWSGGRARQAFCDPAGPDASRMLWAFVRRQFDGARAPARP